MFRIHNLEIKAHKYLKSQIVLSNIQDFVHAQNLKNIVDARYG